MPESISMMFEMFSSMLHWLGKYHESNECANLCRIFRTYEINNTDELEAMLRRTDTKEGQ